MTLRLDGNSAAETVLTSLPVSRVNQTANGVTVRDMYLIVRLLLAFGVINDDYSLGEAKKQRRGMTAKSPNHTRPTLSVTS